MTLALGFQPFEYYYSIFFSCLFATSSCRAVQLIECDCHVRLISKAGSVISSKSPERAFRRSSIYSIWQATQCRWYNRAIIKLKKSLAIMKAACEASPWTTALCRKCRSIWKHVKIPHLIHVFTSNSLHNVSRVFEINPSVRWRGFLHWW